METVDEDWLDYWGVDSPQCCESGQIDLCGVCDGPENATSVYECGCLGLPIDNNQYLNECQTELNPTYGNQACDCSGTVMMDDCGSCGGDNYFVTVDADGNMIGEYCDEEDGWLDSIPPEEYEDENVNNQYDQGEYFDDIDGDGVWDDAIIIEECVLMDASDGTPTDYCDCYETEANECGLCISEDTSSNTNNQECCPIYKDCAGVCYGTALENACGECYGGTLGDCSNSQFNNQLDCEVIENGECNIERWDFNADGFYTVSDTITTYEQCEEWDEGVGKCLVNGSPAKWDHDNNSATADVAIISEDDCVSYGQCTKSTWDLDNDSIPDDVTNEADCLSIEFCLGASAYVDEGDCTMCLELDWVQAEWNLGEWVPSDWIEAVWDPVENVISEFDNEQDCEDNDGVWTTNDSGEEFCSDLSECLIAECGSNRIQCEDAGGF